MLTTSISIAASGDDSRVGRASATTEYPVTGAFAPDSTSTLVDPSRSFFTPSYDTIVGLLKFNTSLPAGSTINSALVRMVPTNKNNADGCSIVMDYYTWTSVNADWTSTPVTTAHSGTTIASLVNSADNDFALTNAAANVPTNGTLYLRMHVTQRAADAAPTGGNWVWFASYDHTTVTEPRLIVTYTLPPSGTFSNQYAAAQDGTTPTGYAGQLTSPDNAVGSGETTQATSTGATQSSNYGSFYSFGTAFSDGLPTGATITAVTLEARQWISTTTRGTVGMSLQSASNTLIGTELSGALSITAAPTAGTAGTGNTYTAWTVLPTAAQLASSNFRVQPRYQRTAAQAATYTLDWLRLSVTYTSPGIPGNVTITAKGG